MEYSNEKRGVLFRNDKKDNKNAPDYKGQAEVEGVEYWLSAWIKTPKSGGDKFMSISFQPKEQQNHDRPDVDSPF